MRKANQPGQASQRNGSTIDDWKMRYNKRKKLDREQAPSSVAAVFQPVTRVVAVYQLVRLDVRMLCSQ
jgi:hypothetical protein